MNNKFEAHKLEVQLKRSGRDFTILRQYRNEFGELSQDYVKVGTIKGLLHGSVSSILSTITTSDTSSSRAKPDAQFLCLADEVCMIGLKPYDIVLANCKYYRVQSLNDIEEWGIIYDVLLEVVDHGVEAELE